MGLADKSFWVFGDTHTPVHGVHQDIIDINCRLEVWESPDCVVVGDGELVDACLWVIPEKSEHNTPGVTRGS